MNSPHSHCQSAACVRVAAAVVIFLVTVATAQAGKIKTIASTVPANGDVNPYGVAIVPRSGGVLTKGNILVSNFNNSMNLQGTGSTIVQITPSGQVSLFAQIDPTKLPGKCPGGIGLTTALVALRSGFVVVGSLPTKDGSAGTAKAGCLLVLDNNGNVVRTLHGHGINGPWDMTAADFGEFVQLFVTNVLNGTVKGGGKVVNRGTVLRINLRIRHDRSPDEESRTIIGSKFSERTDPNALVIGPTGVALSDDLETLFVSDTLNNRIAAIDAPLIRDESDGNGQTVSKGHNLNGPLGMTIAPNGDVLTVNGGDGNMVETDPESGHQVRTVTLDTHNGGGGNLFGLADVKSQGVYFVDDNTNTLNLFH